jgi:hypothetical protein
MNFSLILNMRYLSVFAAVIIFGGCGGTYRSQVENLGGKVSLKIDLSNSEVTDADLENFDFPETIREIHLVNTAVTDRGVESLGRFENLEFVNLMGTQITADAIQTLTQFPNLKSANVMADEVDVKSIKAFRKFLFEKNGNRQQEVIIASPPYE